MRKLDELTNRKLKALQFNRKNGKRYLAFVLSLCMMMGLGTAALLTRNGVAQTYQKKVLVCPYAGGVYAHVHNEDCYDETGKLVCPLPELEAHYHTEDCYETVSELTCGLEKSAGHVHTEECYALSDELICGLEESEGHSHSDDCYAWNTEYVCGLEEDPEHIHDDSCLGLVQGELICGLEESEGHTHTESCYARTDELICGLEEGEGAHSHDESCYTTRQVLSCGLQGIHVHGPDCYDEAGNLVCGQQELTVHVHGADCIKTVDMTEEEVAAMKAAEEAADEEPYDVVDDGSNWQLAGDLEADVENEELWQEMFADFKSSGDWRVDLLTVAESQLGYAESSANYALTPRESVKGYTRYGAWYGIPYGDWCAMFVSFCIRWADIDAPFMPIDCNCANWIVALEEKGLYASAAGYLPKPGDLVFYDFNGDDHADHVGIVEALDAETDTLITIEGNRTDAVERFTQKLSEAHVLGWGILPERPADYIPLRKLPAAHFEKSTDTVTVTVDAPAGAFPAGVELQVRDVEDEAVLAAASGSVNAEVKSVQAVDITFVDADGNEIEPRLPVHVVMTPIAPVTEGSQTVVHVDNEGAGTVVEQTENSAEGEVAFHADAFSVYAIVYTVDVYYTSVTGETYKISLSYDANAGLPQDVELAVNEIHRGDYGYKDYLEQALEKIGADSVNPADCYARFFDIKIKADGQVIEPKGQVKVQIALSDAPEAAEETKVVHFASDALSVVESEGAVNGETGETELSFLTDGFSVYGVITVPGPASANDLAGRTVTMNVGGQYLKNADDQSRVPNWILKGGESTAAEWTFEATGTPGVYNIYTQTESGKQYIHIERAGNNGYGSANAFLSAEPQGLSVQKNSDGTYGIYCNINGTNYYLNQYGGGVPDNGFAAWSDGDDYNSKLNFVFNPPALTAGKEYMVLVKQGDDDYYIVLNDGRLSPVEYHEEDHSVTVDDPMLWTWTGTNLYHHSTQVAYDGNKLPTDFYYRYIDPTDAQGWSEDDPDEVTLKDNGKKVETRPHMAVTTLTYENGKLRSTVDQNSYIGVKQEKGTWKIKGNASDTEAVEILFADAVRTSPVGWTHHTVNHIDISIDGTTSADVPLAYGKYYDEDHNLVLNVTNFQKLKLTEEQVKDKSQLEITVGDMKRATIRATVPGDNGPVELNDAFYLAGYSANDAFNDGESGEHVSDTVQVRIEGSFKVANLDGTPYETVEAYRYDHDEEYKNAVNQARLNHKVTYSVTVVKPITFNLEWPQPVLDGSGNPVLDDKGNPTYKFIQLYDADGEPLTVTADVAFSASFDFWDERNECPPLQGNNYGFGHDRWQSGEIWNVVDRISGCGMDFRLGSNVETGVKVYAVEITKMVVDENGNRIRSNDAGESSFGVYRTSQTSEDVKDLNVGSATTDPLTYPNPQLQHTKTVSIGEDGLGLVYDYDVTQGVYYITEDPNSIEKDITDTSGKEWSYKETYILTEYAWRNHQNDNYVHVSPTYTDGQGSYGSVPEILGEHLGYNDGNTYTNDFLEFFVYNVYESPKVDVPVLKTWEDFAGDEYNWQASFKLQWAPLYEGQNVPIEAFQDVTPLREMTITKADMDGVTQGLVTRYLAGEDTLTEDEIAKVEKLTFQDLPKYGTDANGNTFRYQYSLEETEYQVTDSTTGVILYSWSETEGYNDPENGQYVPYYPHDAGEVEDPNHPEQSEANTNYYVQVDNGPRKTKENEKIDVSVEKRWNLDSNPDEFDERGDDYWAEFELKRFVHTEYRDLSHMSDADRTADPVTVTIKDSEGQVVSELQVQPNVGLYMGGNFRPHDAEKSVTFTADHPVRLANDSHVSTITATATGSNQSNALVRSQEFFVTEDTVFTIGEGAENLVGDSPARVLDTAAGTSPLPDRSFSQTIRLDKDNDWKANLTGLLRSETIVDGAGNENVTYYEYYFVEKGSNPKGYARYFKTYPDVFSGDSDHQIEETSEITAVNGPANRLRVKKLWRGVPDNTGFPAITFTLYQTWADGNNGWVYHNPDTDASYEHIELSGNALEWICPESLPATRLDGSNSRAVKYYVMEDEQSGSVPNGGVNVGWKFYYYLTSEGQQTNAGNQGYFAAIRGQNIIDNPEGGTITICNAMNAYMQMDIQKQFFLLGSDGSWDNVTSHADMRRGAILGFQVIRAVKAPDGKWLDARGNESDTPVWMDYGEEMLCGYDENGNTVVSRGENDIFWLHDAGGDWHFRIENNEGDHSNVNAGGAGLPSYGFFIRNGEDLPVEYWYSFREIGVYKNLDKDPYPEWDWFSSVTPVNAYGPNGTMEAFPKAFHGQDGKRIANFQASDLIIDKDWIGEPDATAVYVKIWRTSGGGEPEDFTAVIADDIRSNSNWQYYVDDVSSVDLGRNCLVLDLDASGNGTAAIKVNRALLGSLAETGKYHYYIQEVGYRTASGEYKTNVNGTYKPLYDKWVGTATEGSYTNAPVGMNDYAGNNIQIGSKGENRLKVINRTTPSTTYKVTKAFSGTAAGSTAPSSGTAAGSPSSVTGKYPTDGSKQVVVMLQQRYRYEKTVGGKLYVSADDEYWVEADSPAAAEAWCNYASEEGWQSAESASPVCVVLPLPKPEGSTLSDEAWYGSAAAWSYTWEGLDVVKVLAEDADPNESKTAQLYYRAVEVSTPGWFNSLIETEDQQGHKAEANVQTTTPITNKRSVCELELNKEWTGLGEGETWPEGVTIDYQLVQYFHLALADTSTIEDGVIKPKYDVGKTFKIVDMTTPTAGTLAESPDSRHPQATGINVGKPTDGSKVIARITDLPRYGFLTATEADKEEAAEHGVTLEVGTVYPVVYTYGVKETAVKKNENPIGFKQQTVEAELDETVTGKEAYKATLTNEMVSLTVEKEWNGLTPGTSESATIDLRRFEKDPEEPPETQFLYTVTVTGSDVALNSSGTVTAVIYGADNNEVASHVLSKNDWSYSFKLDKLDEGKTYHAVFTASDDLVLDKTSEAGISEENNSTTLTATVKPVASGSVKVVVTGSPSNLWMNPLQDANGTELSPQKKFDAYFNGNSGETKTIDGLMPRTQYRFQIGAVPSSVENAEYNNEFITFTAVDGLLTITLNYESGGGGGSSNTTSGSFTGASNYWGINDWNHLTVGQTYSFIFQVNSDPTKYTVTATGVTSCTYNVTGNWGSSGQITVTFVPASTDEEVVITASQAAGLFSQRNTPAAAKSAFSAPLRAPAPIIWTDSDNWTNNTANLPEGADPENDEVVDTAVTFSGGTWSKTWTELPKYSEDGKEYVYYAVETDCVGAAGATSLVTTYSKDENGNWTVTNTPTFPDAGTLEVDKEVLFGGERDLTADNLAITVGIFTDAEGKTPVEGQSNQTITVQDGHATAIFTGLPAGTYYVFEIVDEKPVTKAGTKATISGLDYTVTYSGSPAEVSNGATAKATITNTKKPFTLTVKKVDADNTEKLLGGAKFELTQLTCNAETKEISYIGDPREAETSSEQNTLGTAAFDGLVTGWYEVKETRPPDGYILTGDAVFYIKVTGEGVWRVTREDGKTLEEWAVDESTSGVVIFDHTSATATVTNTHGTELPQAGGEGTARLMLLGAVLMLGSALLLAADRRRRKETV